MKNEQEQMHEAEFDAYRDSYEEDIHNAISFAGQEHDFYMQVKVDALLEEATKVGPLNTLNVLDLGCGTGETIRKLEGSFAELHGVDVSSGVVDRARKACPFAVFGVYDGSRLPYEEGFFDVVYCMCVVHHVPPKQWVSFMAEAKRVLKPGGVLIIFEHNPLNPVTRHVVNRCVFDENAVLLHQWRCQSCLREAGFVKAIKVHHILFTPFSHRFFRWLEGVLRHVPMGAQYLCVAPK